MSEPEKEQKRPTQDCDIEIIGLITGPDGFAAPIVIGAGSFEDFDRACTEGDELAAAADETMVVPDGLRAEHILRSMAAAGGVLPQALFYAGNKLGQSMRSE